MQAALEKQSDEWLAENNVDRSVKCFVDITVEKVGTVYQNRNCGIDQGLVVSCPKELIDVHAKLMHKALIFPTPPKDLQDLTFLPFKYKTSKPVKDGQ